MVPFLAYTIFLKMRTCRNINTLLFIAIWWESSVDNHSRTWYG